MNDGREERIKNRERTKKVKESERSEGKHMNIRSDDQGKEMIEEREQTKVKKK